MNCFRKKEKNFWISKNKFLKKIMKTGCLSKLSSFIRFFIICFLGIFSLIHEASAVDDHDNRHLVISPYWQSDSTSYSFIAVTHPSLSDMASQIGLTINAIQSDLSAFSTALSFTVSAGKTERVFIVRSGHSVINPTIIPSGHFIVGTTSYRYGNIIVRNVATFPYNKTGKPDGWPSDGDGWRDITMLSFFGGIVFDHNTTGFAMEFIGDTQDSTTTFDWNQSATSGVN